MLFFWCRYPGRCHSSCTTRRLGPPRFNGRSVSTPTTIPVSTRKPSSVRSEGEAYGNGGAIIWGPQTCRKTSPRVIFARVKKMWIVFVTPELEVKSKWLEWKSLGVSKKGFLSRYLATGVPKAYLFGALIWIWPSAMSRINHMYIYIYVYIDIDSMPIYTYIYLSIYIYISMYIYIHGNPPETHLFYIFITWLCQKGVTVTLHTGLFWGIFGNSFKRGYYICIYSSVVSKLGWFNLTSMIAFWEERIQNAFPAKSKI